MGKQRREFTEEYRQGIVRRLAAGEKAADVCREEGLSAGLVSLWKSTAKKSGAWAHLELEAHLAAEPGEGAGCPEQKAEEPAVYAPAAGEVSVHTTGDSEFLGAGARFAEEMPLAVERGKPPAPPPGLELAKLTDETLRHVRTDDSNEAKMPDLPAVEAETGKSDSLEPPVWQPQAAQGVNEILQLVGYRLEDVCGLGEDVILVFYNGAAERKVRLLRADGGAVQVLG
ncbi:transposase [Clostridia bacterium OttesenSCG-928-O13]|nr:transposase [Clostridia bacterium OttesenSCG-928-O13]